MLHPGHSAQSSSRSKEKQSDKASLWATFGKAEVSIFLRRRRSPVVRLCMLWEGAAMQRRVSRARLCQYLPYGMQQHGGITSLLLPSCSQLLPQCPTQSIPKASSMSVRAVCYKLLASESLPASGCRTCGLGRSNPNSLCFAATIPEHVCISRFAFPQAPATLAWTICSL